MMTVGNGLQGQYFDTPDLTNAALVRTDAQVDFNWNAGSPSASINAESFSVRWTGQVEAQVTESHDFHVVANDGARLWVNGQLLIDRFDDATTNATGTIDLISGRRYDIQLEYRENNGDASVRLEWSSESQNREVIPQQYLFAGNRGEILIERFNSIGGSAVSNLTDSAQFPGEPSFQGLRSAFESDSNIGSSFGQRLAGFLHPPETGPYTFFIAGDQSAELLLSNSADPENRQRIASVTTPTQFRQWDASTTQRSATIYLAAGQSYFIEALHKESSGNDHLSVGWIRPGQSTVEVISGDYLSAERPTVLGFAVDPNGAESGARAARYEITRTGPTTQALVVDYRLSGDAVNGVDYQQLNGSITIAAGQRSVILDITPLADPLVEGDESVIVELLHTDRYEVGFKSERTFNAVLLDDAQAPAGGTPLWTQTNLAAFSAFGASFSTVNDPTFGNVIQANVGNVPSSFSAQLRKSIELPVNQGDVVFAEFYVRSVGAEDGSITAFFEVNRAPFTKSLLQGMSVSNQWTKVQIPFSTVESYAAGAASFGFFLGDQAQSLQFANFKLLNYGASSGISPVDDLRLNNINGNFGTAAIVPVTGQSFRSAFEVETTSIPPQVWRIQARETNSTAVAAGDTMRFEFYIRSIAGTNPQTDLVVQETQNFSTLFSQSIGLTSQWQRHSIDVSVDQDFDVGGLSTVFNLGFGLQTVQIADFSWTRVGQGVTIDQLPSQAPSVSYGGREANSDWRASADQRIEQERTSSATVNVLDANGRALEGAVVSLRQTDHAFRFGSAVSAFENRLSANPSESAQRYQDEVNRLFNTVVLENAHKWEQFLNDRNRGIEAAEFAVNSDLYLRGHNIIWPSRQFMPDSVWNEYDSRVASNGLASANQWLGNTINARFDDVLNTFDGIIAEWDVVNEPFTNRDVLDILGDQVLVDWYQRVRDFDPNISLALNDFNIFTSNGGNTAHRADFESWLGQLNEAGLLDVIGVQSHFTSSNLTDIDVLEGLITQYDNQFNQTLAVTEFDVATFDEQLQADYLRDYLTQSFSQSGVSQIVQWGFWEGAHFQPEAALYRLDYSVKPNGQAYEDLVFGKWWSDVQGTTTEGRFSSDVFDGEYDIVVQYGGQTYNATMSVGEGGASEISITLPVEAINYGAQLTQAVDSVTGDALSTLTNSGTWFEPEGETVSLSASLGQASINADGTWDWQLTSNQRYVNQAVVITATDGSGAVSSTQFTINNLTSIGKRGVSYGNSTGFEDTEVPSGIDGLLPGQTASQANYTNYTRGLNRVVIEVAGLASSEIDSSDFEFRVGNTNNPSDWLLLSETSSIALPTVSVQSGDPGQPDKIVLAWPDNAIENTWLQVTVKSTVRTGLDTADVFYLGNQIGDVNGDVNNQNRVRVNSFDTILTRLNQGPTTTTNIDDIYDVDRSGRVNSFDVIRVRLNQDFNGLLLFTPPDVGPVASASAAALSQPIAVQTAAVQRQEDLVGMETTAVEAEGAQVPLIDRVNGSDAEVDLPPIQKPRQTPVVSQSSAIRSPAATVVEQEVAEVDTDIVLEANEKVVSELVRPNLSTGEAKATQSITTQATTPEVRWVRVEVPVPASPLGAIDSAELTDGRTTEESDAFAHAQDFGDGPSEVLGFVSEQDQARPSIAETAVSQEAAVLSGSEALTPDDADQFFAEFDTTADPGPQYADAPFALPTIESDPSADRKL